jgi:hypothetical protein
VHRRVLLLLAAVAAAVGATTTTAVPSAAEDPVPPAMAFVGDSVGTQSKEEVAEEVRRTRRITHMLVANGATIPWSRPDVVEAVTGPRAPSILVVELGHADTAWGWRDPPAHFERTLRRFLTAVAPHVDCIRWLDIKPERTRFIEVNRSGHIFNRVLREVVADYPNAEVWHYSDWALHVAGPMWRFDRLHLSTPVGERELGRMVRQAADSCDPALHHGPFWDVMDSDPNAAAIAWVGEQGIVNGYPNGTYRARIASLHPAATRGQWATALWRLSGSPAAAQPAPWTDLRPNQAGALAWVSQRGLISGYADGTWRPEGKLTKGAALRALWLLAGQADAPASTWTGVPPRLAGAAAWAQSVGLAFPDRTGRFDAAAPVSRGMLAALLAPPDHQGPLAPPPAPPAPSPPPEVVELTVHGEPILSATP